MVLANPTHKIQHGNKKFRQARLSPSSLGKKARESGGEPQLPARKARDFGGRPQLPARKARDFGGEPQLPARKARDFGGEPQLPVALCLTAALRDVESREQVRERGGSKQTVGLLEGGV
jgi:hypothetical protein